MLSSLKERQHSIHEGYKRFGHRWRLQIEGLISPKIIGIIVLHFQSLLTDYPLRNGWISSWTPYQHRRKNFDHTPIWAMFGRSFANMSLLPGYQSKYESTPLISLEFCANVMKATYIRHIRAHPQTHSSLMVINNRQTQVRIKIMLCLFWSLWSICCVLVWLLRPRPTP